MFKSSLPADTALRETDWVGQGGLIVRNVAKWTLRHHGALITADNKNTSVDQLKGRNPETTIWIPRLWIN